MVPAALVRLVLISPSPCFLYGARLFGDQLEERDAAVRSVEVGKSLCLWPGGQSPRLGWGGICRASRHLAEAGAVLP